jgi:hypothetical protein
MIGKVLCLAAAIAMALPAATAMGQAGGQSTEMSAAKKAKKQRNVRAAGQQKIACTFFGCHPVPRGCTPVTGRDFFGNPTDYDDVVCR